MLLLLITNNVNVIICMQPQALVVEWVVCWPTTYTSRVQILDETSFGVLLLIDFWQKLKE